MNYYEHHIGDFAQATSHLSFVEDAAYSRMIRKYYAEEKPLPGDIKAVQRLVGARTKDEKEAVETVLQEFFFLESDGYHNKRCDSEIEKFLEDKEEKEAAKANEKERQRRHREERKELFEALRIKGIVPKWDTPTNQLRELAGNAHVTPPVTVTAPDLSQPVTPPVTPDNTATQTPIPIPIPELTSISEPTVPPDLAISPPSAEVRLIEVPDRLVCPVKEIVALFHELMPNNPRCKVINQTRRKLISARWREASRLAAYPFDGGYSTRESGLAKWREFFSICAESHFLTGRTRPAEGRPPFFADVDFLLSPSGFAKTLENKYHREVA